LLLITIEPSHVLWGIAVAYGVSGYVGWFVQRIRADAAQKQYRNIREAIEDGDVVAVARLLSTTPVDAVVAQGGRTLMMVAVEETNVPAIGLLIARGASLEARDDRGMTAIALAAEMAFRDAVDVLLDAGADPNARDLTGATPLDIAEEHGAHDISAMLLRYGGKSGKELAPQNP
jgi:ankyrin repeat protein